MTLEEHISALEERIAKIEAKMVPLLERDNATREAEQGMIDILEGRGSGWKRYEEL